LLLSASLLGAVVILEAGLQIHYRGKTGTWFFSGNRAFEAGYTKPVSDRRKYSLRENYRDEKIGLHIDGKGFRRNEQETRAQAVLVALGDSVPFGAGVADKDTYPSRLNRLLAEKFPGENISVLNAGVPSYNLRQSFDRLDFEVRKKISQRIVLVTIQAANDISLLTHYRDCWSPDVTWADVRFPSSPARSQLILGQSFLALLEKRKKKEGENHKPYPDGAVLDNLRQVLAVAGDAAASKGSRIILMPIDPFYYQLSRQDKNPALPGWRDYRGYVELWGGTIDRINQTLNDFALKNKNTIFFFDTRSIMDERDRARAYIDFIHLSPQGNQIVAENLLAFIIKNRLLEIHREKDF